MMGAKVQAENNADFPMLASAGLCITDITGDGNCLFRALADQIHGSQTSHPDTRARVLQYLRDNPNDFKPFIAVGPEPTRQNPKRNAKATKRKMAGSVPAAVTEQQVDTAWSRYLKNMSEEGTWGGDIEITAFAGAFDTNVKIWQPDDNSPYIIRCPNNPGEKPIVHIAFHSWQHYSSVRNIAGPYTGLPQIRGQDFSVDERASLKAQSTSLTKVKEWMITTVQNSVPRFIDNDTAKRALEDANCNVDNAVSKLLLDMSDGSSTSSNPGSSISTEREPDSDDEDSNGPNKRQDRRMSRATRAMRKAKERAASDDSRNLNLDGAGSNQERSLTPVDLSNRIIKRPVSRKSRRKVVRDTEGDEESTSCTTSLSEDENPLKTTKEDDMISEYSTTSHSQSRASTPAAPPIKITLKVTSSKSAAGKTEGLQQKRLPARDQQALKKAAQKAARKESKRNKSAQAPQHIDTANSSQNHLGQGMKALFI